MFNTHITLYYSICHVYNPPVIFCQKSQSVQVCRHVLLKLSESLYLHFLIKYFTFLSSIPKEHCKIYFTITLMSPDQIWPDIIWADKICISIGIEVTIDLKRVSLNIVISNVIIALE